MDSAPEQPKLDDIILFSVGIGRSFQEATEAIQHAKTAGRRTEPFNIKVYSGDPIQDQPPAASNAPNFLVVRRYLQANGAGQEVLKALGELGTDPKTGLLNKLGYETSRMELSELGRRSGYYILLDGNDMHGHNAEKGYTGVDLYLEAAGHAIKAILHETRSGLDRRQHSTDGVQDEKRKRIRRFSTAQQEDIFAHVLGHRVNDSAGDEFLLFIPDQITEAGETIQLEPRDIYTITRRVLRSVYSQERRVGDTHEQ